MMPAMETRFTAVIKDVEEEQRRFWGTAYIHSTLDGPVEDHSGDIVDTPEAQAALEDAFYQYVKNSRAGDAGHELFDAADMIEGFVVTKDKKTAGIFPDGMPEGIYVGFQARDTDAGNVLWERVKSGEYQALSIVGEAEVEAIT